MRLLRLSFLSSSSVLIVAVVGSACGNPSEGQPVNEYPAPTTTTSTFDASPAPWPEDAGRMSNVDARPAPTRIDASGTVAVREAATAPDPPPPPSVADPRVVEGPWGTLVTLKGEGLGSATRSNVFLIVGDDEELVLTPDDSDLVSTWTESEIVLRVPFPVSGALQVETPQGVAEAGRFEPSWTRTAHAMEPAVSELSSLSAVEGHIAVLADDETLLEYAAQQVTSKDFDLSGAGADPSTVRLYASEEGAVLGFGLSEQLPRTLLEFASSETSYSGYGTDVALEGDEFAVAGGPDGAAVWVHQEAGWRRARPLQAGWAFDAGPIADPNPNGKKRAAGATSDGALYIGWAVDSGNFFDDMERPVVRRLGPGATTFEASVPAGRSTDDYLTSLSLLGRGPGLIVHYCGSDVDPWGLSSTGYACFTSARTTDGAEQLRALNEGTGARYAMTPRTISVAYCDGEDNLRIASDLESDPGEPVLWPCVDVVAFELDPTRQPLLVVKTDRQWHFLQRRAEDGE